MEPPDWSSLCDLASGGGAGPKDTLLSLPSLQPTSLHTCSNSPEVKHCQVKSLKVYMLYIKLEIKTNKQTNKKSCMLSVRRFRR